MLEYTGIRTVYSKTQIPSNRYLSGVVCLWLGFFWVLFCFVVVVLLVL